MPGVMPALDYLTAATKAVLDGTESVGSARGRNVVIVGNGDTATDCVATALRQGAASVTQLVRKPRPESEPRKWPYRAAGERTDYGQEEAAAVSGHDPRLYGTTVKTLVPDENGALRAVIVTAGGRERELPAEILLTATGFSGAEAEAAETFGLRTSWVTDAAPCRSAVATQSKVFACGDMRRGASLVVWAIAEGRACARSADEYLEGYTNL